MCRTMLHVLSNCLDGKQSWNVQGRLWKRRVRLYKKTQKWIGA